VLRIRDEQIAVFQQAADERLIALLVSYARTQGVERFAGASEDELRGFVEAGIARARAHGASAPEALSTFVGLTVVLGDDFDAHPWAARILGNSGAAPDDRVLALFDAAPHRDGGPLRTAGEEG
jgi:hypothetical protein